jgi:alkylation response protein AidB-like acyl-CoA dehydrogenase
VDRAFTEADGFRAELRTWLQGAQRPAGLRDYGATPATEDVAAARAWQRVLYDGGWAGVSWPVEHGGRGASVLEQAVYAEEAALAGVPRYSSLTSTELAGPMIFSHGSPQQREKFLDPILRGEHLWCQLFSEPEAGSDLAALKARARPVDGGWRLRGQKIWSSGAHYADHGLLLARTDPDDRYGGISCFLLPMQRSGIDIRPTRQLDGESKFAEVFFDDVELTPDDVLGEIGMGWTIALSTLGRERLTLGAQAVGMKRMLERLRGSVELAPGEAERYAELWGRIDALRAAWIELVAGGSGPQDPRYSVLKLMSSKLHQDIPALAVDAFGPSAVAGRNSDWSEVLLGSLSATIAGGTSEIQREIIAERVLGLPR